MGNESKKEYLKRYQAENRERIAAQRKAYREQNRERVALQKREYAERNKDKVKLAQSAKYEKNKERYLQQMKEMYAANSEEIKKKRMDYYYKNKDRINARQKESKDKNRGKERPQKAAYCRRRRAKDVNFLLIGRMRCGINDALRLGKFPKTGKTSELLGSDMDTLRSHIESKFKEGMTWENRRLWHIDHVIPLSSAKTIEEINGLFHYLNLQPLWASENLKKGSRVLSNAE
jgi:hypothetical protein